MYISEAHAQNIWPISSSKCHPSKKPVIINQHKNNFDRLLATKRLINDFKLDWEVWYDPYPSEIFEKTFSAWPARFLIFNQSKLIFANRTKDGGVYDIENLIIKLDNLVN